MVEHIEAAANLFTAIPRTWDQAKLSIAIVAIFSGFGAAIFSWKQGLGTVYGKALGGIGLGAIALGAMGILMSMKQSCDSTNVCTGGISYNGQASTVTRIENPSGSADLDKHRVTVHIAA